MAGRDGPPTQAIRNPKATHNISNGGRRLSINDRKYSAVPDPIVLKTIQYLDPRKRRSKYWCQITISPASALESTGCVEFGLGFHKCTKRQFSNGSPQWSRKVKPSDTQFTFKLFSDDRFSSVSQDDDEVCINVKELKSSMYSTDRYSFVTSWQSSSIDVEAYIQSDGSGALLMKFFSSGPSALIDSKHLALQSVVTVHPSLSQPSLLIDIAFVNYMLPWSRWNKECRHTYIDTPRFRALKQMSYGLCKAIPDNTGNLPSYHEVVFQPLTTESDVHSVGYKERHRDNWVMWLSNGLILASQGSHARIFDGNRVGGFDGGDIVGVGIIYAPLMVFFTLNGKFQCVIEMDRPASDISPSPQDHNMQAFYATSTGYDSLVSENSGERVFRIRDIAHIKQEAVARHTSRLRLCGPRQGLSEQLPFELIYMIVDCLIDLRQAQIAPTGGEQSLHHRARARGHWMDLASRMTFRGALRLPSQTCHYWANILRPALFEDVHLKSLPDFDSMVRAILAPAVHTRLPSMWTYVRFVRLVEQLDLWTPKLLSNSCKLALPSEPVLVLDRSQLVLNAEEVERRTPPRLYLHRGLPFAFTFQTIQSLVLLKYTFPSFAICTRFLRSFPNLKTLRCDYIYWKQYVFNPRLIRPHPKLSTLVWVTHDDGMRVQTAQFSQLFTNRWGRCPIDWDPLKRSPEMNETDQCIVYEVIRLILVKGTANRNQTWSLDFSYSVVKKHWYLSLEYGHIKEDPTLAFARWVFTFAIVALDLDAVDHRVVTALIGLSLVAHHTDIEHALFQDGWSRLDNTLSMTSSARFRNFDITGVACNSSFAFKNLPIMIGRGQLHTCELG